MNKFEQLIEYVINDEEAKARELFHEIVVEKSRTIYESMMEEEAEEIEESAEEEIEEDMGGDQVDDLIDDVEVEEEGLSMEAEEQDDDMSDDMGDDEEPSDDLEDRVIDLEDKIDEIDALMAEFESMLGGSGDEEMDMDLEVTDTPDMSPEEVADDEMETEGMRMPMEEAVDLKAAPKPVTSEEGGINKKSTVASNSGARGAMAKPVHMGDGEEKGRSAPQAKDMGSTTQPNVKPATKPHLAQAAGVNAKSVIE